MRRRVGVAVVAAMALFSIGSVSAASAATEVGNRCVADALQPELTMVQLTQETGALPIEAPSDGVVTEWKVNLAPVSGVFPTRMRVLRSAGGNEYTTVAQSEFGAVTSGSNSFKTRISVESGDRFGSFGAAAGTLYCDGGPGDRLGYYEGNAVPGSTKAYEGELGFRLAMSVVIEPDADGDGYGDETQDLCPQSALEQAACPYAFLWPYGFAYRRSAKIVVTTSYPAPVAVTGAVNVPRRLLRGKRASGSAQIDLSGGVQQVAPGGIAVYTLKVPRALRKALRNLARKRSLTLAVTTSATDVAGRASSSTARVKLRGQKRAKRRQR